MTSVLPSEDIPAIAPGLEKSQDGIWFSRDQQDISYPDEGNAHCLALEENSFWFVHRSQCIQAVVRRFPPPGRVFDIGGGNGYVAAGLIQAGIPAALVEPGRQGVQNARQRGVDLLICSTLESAGFRPESLPAAGLFDVLEHISAEGEFLKSLHGLLVPGGRVYLTVPAFQPLWSADDDYAGHYRRYTRGMLSAALQKAGFRVEFSTYIFFMLPVPIFLFRALPSRMGMRKQEAWGSYHQEHSRRAGVTGWLLQRLLDWELAQIRCGRPVRLGGSCLAVAIK